MIRRLLARFGYYKITHGFSTGMHCMRIHGLMLTRDQVHRPSTDDASLYLYGYIPVKGVMTRHMIMTVTYTSKLAGEVSNTEIEDHMHRLCAEIEKAATDQIYMTGFITAKPKLDTPEKRDFWDSVERIALGNVPWPWKKGWF